MAQYPANNGDGRAVLSEIVGYSISEIGSALDLVESTMKVGNKARVSLCTETLVTKAELNEIYNGMIATGSHVSRPTSRLIQGVPTTQFTLTRGSPLFLAIVPVLVPIFTVGLIAFGIAKIGEIGAAITKILIVSGIIVVAVLVLARKPATAYIERGGKVPLLAAASKKALAAR